MISIQKELISVIVPVYKAENYLEICVNSILSQTYKNIEVILVNDGSPDGSGILCGKLAERDNRVRVIHKENGGAASARNAGIDAARGEFVAFVDSDDTIDADMYKQLYKRITESGADICQCGYKAIYDGYKHVISAPNELMVAPGQVWESLLTNYLYTVKVYMIHWNKLIRASLLNGEGRDSEQPIRYPECVRVYEDMWFVVDCIAAAKRGVASIKTPSYNWMRSNNPLSLSKNVHSDEQKEHPLKMIIPYDDKEKALNHLKKIMFTVLPEKSREIEETIRCQLCVTVATDRHKSIIFKQKQLHKLKWRTVATILRYSTSKEEKYSALMLYFFPPPLYRTVYRLYAKRQK